MTFGEYLFHLRRKNPGMNSAGESKMTITISSFEVQLKRAYEARQQHEKTINGLDGLFGDFLGKKK